MDEVDARADDPGPMPPLLPRNDGDDDGDDGDDGDDSESAAAPRKTRRPTVLWEAMAAADDGAKAATGKTTNAARKSRHGGRGI